MDSSVEAGESFVAFAITFLCKAFATLTAFKRPIVPMSSEMIHHVTHLGEVGLTDFADENLVHAFSFVVVDTASSVVHFF